MEGVGIKLHPINGNQNYAMKKGFQKLIFSYQSLTQLFPPDANLLNIAFKIN